MWKKEVGKEEEEKEEGGGEGRGGDEERRLKLTRTTSFKILVVGDCAVGNFACGEPLMQVADDLFRQSILDGVLGNSALIRYLTGRADM